MMPPLLRTIAADFDGAQTLVASFQLKLYLLAFPQPVKIQTLQSAAVKEYFLAVIGSNKAEATVADQSFNSTRHGEPHVRKRKGSPSDWPVDKLPPNASITLYGLYQPGTHLSKAYHAYR